jgi:2-dehydropantoate 2-reductase
VVLEADPAHARLIRDPGLIVDRDGRRTSVPMEVVERPADLNGRFDVALLFLKANHLAGAVPALVRDDRVDLYLSFGNGLVQSQVSDMVGAGRMAAGIVEWGATRVGPGHVVRTTEAPFVLGQADVSRSEKLSEMVSLLGAVAPVELADHIDSRIWSKLVLNSTFSGLGAVSGLLYEGVAAHPLGRTVAYELWAEGCAVATGAGVSLDPVAGVDPYELVIRSSDDLAAAERALDELMSKLGPTKASMLQDLLGGRLTEVDVINGGVSSVGARVGEATPYNDAVVQMVHDMETGRRRPDPAVFEELAALERSGI